MKETQIQVVVKSVVGPDTMPDSAYEGVLKLVALLLEDEKKALVEHRSGSESESRGTAKEDNEN